MGSLAAPILARAGEMRLPGASRISYFCNGKIYVSEVGKAEGKPGDEVAMVTFNQNRESKSRHMQAYILLNSVKRRMCVGRRRFMTKDGLHRSSEGNQIWVTTGRAEEAKPSVGKSKAKPQKKGVGASQKLNGGKLELFAIAVDLETGRIIHDIQVFDAVPQLEGEGQNTHATPTPVVEVRSVGSRARVPNG